MSKPDLLTEIYNYLNGWSEDYSPQGAVPLLRRAAARLEVDADQMRRTLEDAKYFHARLEREAARTGG